MSIDSALIPHAILIGVPIVILPIVFITVLVHALVKKVKGMALYVLVFAIAWILLTALLYVAVMLIAIGASHASSGGEPLIMTLLVLYFLSSILFLWLIQRRYGKSATNAAAP